MMARRWFRKGKESRSSVKALDPIPLAEAFAAAPGTWLAIDRRTGEVVAADTTPYALVAKLKQDGITNVAIVRSPGEEEPELVGLG